MSPEKLKKSHHSSKFSFGSSSAIITNIALILGLDTAANAKTAIIGSLLVIALADNISDTLGIHMYQESEGLGRKQVLLLSFSNFLSRFITSLGFILIVFLLPISLAVWISAIYGLLVLSGVSYLIARDRRLKPIHTIFEHLVVATIVIILSKFAGSFIISHFK
jgi:vacuolar iron transporter family protein